MKMMPILFIVLFIFVFEVKTQCRLTLNMVTDEKRIFAIEYQGQLVPLGEDTIAVGTTISLICNSNLIETTVCQSNGTFDKTIPVGNCDKPIQPTVEKINDATCNHDTYRVGYKMGTNFLELYRSCYDKEHVHAKYVKHSAWHYVLVTKLDHIHYNRDRIITGAEAATFSAKEVYKRFNTLLGTQQQYITSESQFLIHRGHLAPVGDYLFPSSMRATLKYINLTPQFGSINYGNWKSIESWIRRRLQSASGPAFIKTGTSDEVLQLRDSSNKLKSIFLAMNNKNPISKWIYKIYEDNNGRVIFMIYNNIFGNQRPVAPCATIACPLQLSDKPESGFTYCCDPVSFVCE